MAKEIHRDHLSERKEESGPRRGTVSGQRNRGEREQVCPSVEGQGTYASRKIAKFWGPPRIHSEV